MITEWKFLMADDGDEIGEAVNAEIKDGWQPYGGVGIAFEDYHDGTHVYHYTQAMVKLDNVGD